LSDKSTQPLYTGKHGCKACTTDPKPENEMEEEPATESATEPETEPETEKEELDAEV